MSRIQVHFTIEDDSKRASIGILIHFAPKIVSVPRFTLGPRASVIVINVTSQYGSKINVSHPPLALQLPALTSTDITIAKIVFGKGHR